MTLSTQPYKGARDFYPEDKRLQKYIFNVLRQVIEKFGYEEYDAPILEPLDIYLAKTGEEIINDQVYNFEDRGGRQVAIRPEMTPTVSRLVAAKRQELSYPLRWYSIPNLWRYERPQRGRLREHWQLNVDIFGVTGVEAEHEMILMIDKVMKALGAKESIYTIKLNSRKLVDTILLNYFGFDKTQAYSISKLIDRMHKMEHADFVALVDGLCTPSQREAGTVENLLSILKMKTLKDLPDDLKSHPSVDELEKLFSLLDASGIKNYEFDITVMRGFDYYTDIVFEVFDNHPDNNRSMLGGGRYDGLVGLFGVEPVPTVGFGLGDVTLENFLRLHELLPKVETETDVYVVLVGEVADKAQKAVAELREMGLNVAVDLTGRKVGAQIKAADKKGIHYAVIIGDQEIQNGQYLLKNLRTGEEEKHSAERIVSIIKDYRQKDAGD